MAAEGSACRVTCTLGSGSEFGIDGSIVRCSEKEAAVFFDSMDEEAFYHLKRLVQYNTTDPDSIDRELAEPFYQAVEKRPPSVAGLLRRTGPSLALRSSFVTAAYEKYASFLIISRALHLNVFEQPV